MLDPGTLPTMGRVAAALEGMPLAIELAAARLRTMSLGQLATGLDDRFRLLTGGSRTALPHHRTLRAVVDWSWDLLTEPERTVLRRLSVFAGAASLDAAEQVCAGAAVGPQDVLDLLTSLTDKSLLRTAGDGAPRYKMTGTIREYAAERLAEAGEADLARHAHLAYFTGLAETADPHLRRAEQLDWLAALGAEHDNIGAAMRGALTASEAQPAMRLAAAAGFYWWLGGHRTEGFELVSAATKLPGEAADEIRAMAYAMVVMFVTAGRADEREAADWIRTAARLSQRSQDRYPMLRLVAPLERLLQGPDAFLPAWESLADDEDPWVRALARFQLGKMRIVLGQGGRDADADLERAVAGFRAIGERYGISLTLTELADRIATRGEFAAACERYEQAIFAVTELGAVEDVIWMRARQAQLYWLLGDADRSAAAMADAERCAERVTWPDALVELALSKAELARWRGSAEDVVRQLGVVTAVLGKDAGRANIRAVEQDLLGYLAADPGEAAAHRAAACQAAAELGYAPLLAKVLIGVADLALRRGEPDQAARLLAASAAVRGQPDRSVPDAARIERATRRRLGETRFAEATRAGTETSWSELVADTLAS